MILLLCASLARADVDTSQQNASGRGSPSGPRQLPDAALRSLDFVYGQETSTIVIGTLSPAPPAGEPLAAQQSGSKVWLDLPGLAVPDSLRRPLDTSQFHAFVQDIRAYPVAGGARVQVTLREDVPHRLIVGEDGFIRLEFDTPAGPRPEAEPPLPARPAPSPLDTFGPSQPLPSLWGS